MQVTAHVAESQAKGKDVNSYCGIRNSRPLLFSTDKFRPVFVKQEPKICPNIFQ